MNPGAFRPGSDVLSDAVEEQANPTDSRAVEADRFSRDMGASRVVSGDSGRPRLANAQHSGNGPESATTFPKCRSARPFEGHSLTDHVQLCPIKSPLKQRSAFPERH
jgi:hypothetical protein